MKVSHETWGTVCAAADTVLTYDITDPAVVTGPSW